MECVVHTLLIGSSNSTSYLSLYSAVAGYKMVATEIYNLQLDEAFPPW